jgi:hypothetical protein
MKHYNEKRSNLRGKKLKKRTKTTERTFSRNIFAHPKIKINNLDNTY